MKARLFRSAVAATVIAAGMTVFGSTAAHAVDACNNGDDPAYLTLINTPQLRVALDDPTSGASGHVVVCIGILEPETLEVGVGLTNPAPWRYNVYYCLNGCTLLYSVVVPIPL